ncbi:MAG: hypothetical protein KHX35_03065 [Sutterella wadsworthensis]|nr:hypothetical protein [Sutterella wadsworthensis]
MSVLFTRRTLLGSMSAAAALWLTGCAATKPIEEPAEPATFTNLGPRATPATPTLARRIPMPVVDAFKGDGIFFFADDEGAQFCITDLIRENNAYPVVENYRFGKPHGFTWGAGAVGIVRDGQRLPPEKPILLRPEGDHVVIVFDGAKHMELHVSLEAYDVSNHEIRDYLRTRGNMPTHAALFMGEERFPEGSIAYATTLWVKQDELLATSATAFTGSNTIEAFSQRFTKETPYCLNVLSGNDVQPIGLRFSKAIQKKTVRKSKRSRPVEVDQTGRVKVYQTKPGTIFCQRNIPDAIGEAAWHLRYVNGTRTLTLAFPDAIDPLSIGLMTANKDNLLPAFAEEKTDKRNGRRVIPAILWLKDKPIRDSQYRFNKTAAKAITDAIKASRPKREAWEAANESEVTRRARALQARKAAAAEAKRAKASQTKRRPKRTTNRTTKRP